MNLDSEKDYNKFIEHVQLSLKISPALKYYQRKKGLFFDRSDKVTWNKYMLVCIWSHLKDHMILPQKCRNHILLGLYQ